MAEELGEQLGQTVGFQVRFASQRSRQTRVKVMTDGIMLAEISHDRDLRRYDTIIIDEAHERSLNIDFLLGYLKQLLPRRPELKVIITSATIDTQRFSDHFDGAPIVEVSGRSYPVEVRYRPVAGSAEERDRDQLDAICDAVTELTARLDGDILVFCSGEREIRDAAEAIKALDLRFTEVVPLYARLSAAEQHRVFAPHTGRRIVLATNVAETSITVPGIRFVIDPGNARISRYSARTKVQRLPIEPISQASANQRTGRCGRLGPGVCIRLYSEEDFAARPEFTQPEILRTNLASVILQMAEAGLGDVEGFGFVEPPDASQVRDGVRLLTELGAIDGRERGHGQRRPGVRLTAVGRKLARLPVDPRLGRMLIEADRLGCLREVLPIVAGITIPDVRERPLESAATADALHRRFWAPVGEDDQASPDGSDIAALLRLWLYLKAKRKELSGNAFRRLCRDEYLNFLRVREWQDLHSQLLEASKELGLHRDDVPADLDRVHTAILAGLASQIGLLDPLSLAKPERGRRRGPAEYLGTRGARFAINPGSSAARSNPELVMAVELVETSRLWARTVAPIKAEWLEQVADHLIKRSYSEPRWSAKGGQCVATERLTLLGVPIVAGRTVSYARIDPVVAREVLIQAALVEGQWRTRHHFWARNQAVRGEAEDLADRNRRRDLLVDDATIAAFYAARIPSDVVSVAHFDRWWSTARHQDPGLLDLSLDDLLDPGFAVDEGAFPDRWRYGALELPIDYAFDPGSGHDGVTVEVPLEALAGLDAAEFSWQVPGLRAQVAAELLRGAAQARPDPTGAGARHCGAGPVLVGHPAAPVRRAVVDGTGPRGRGPARGAGAGRRLDAPALARAPAGPVPGSAQRRGAGGRSRPGRTAGQPGPAGHPDAERGRGARDPSGSDRLGVRRTAHLGRLADPGSGGTGGPGGSGRGGGLRDGGGGGALASGRPAPAGRAEHRRSGQLGGLPNVQPDEAGPGDFRLRQRAGAAGRCPAEGDRRPDRQGRGTGTGARPRGLRGLVRWGAGRGGRPDGATGGRDRHGAHAGRPGPGPVGRCPPADRRGRR